MGEEKIRSIQDVVKMIKNLTQQILKEKSNILDHWRKHHLDESHRPKKFENWFVVELVNKLWISGLIEEIKTNPDVKELKRSYAGDFANKTPDISIKTKEGFTLDIEIKTQVEPKKILNDILIVKHHNEKEKNKNYRACFLWIVLAPQNSDFAQRVWKSVEGVKSRAKEEIGVNIEEFKVEEWLRYYIATPSI
jgi:hypothetical protein